MASSGIVIAKVFTSDAYLPLEGVPVIFTQSTARGQRFLGTKLTDQSGQTPPLVVSSPDMASSLTPDAAGEAFALINIHTAYPGYERIMVTGVQIFPDTITVQPLQLIPLPTASENNAPEETFRLPPQNL